MSTPSDGLLIACRLREARTAIGLSQENVSTAVGIGRSAISAIETGDRRVYGLELGRLARLYRRPVAWLLGHEGDPDIGDEIHAAISGLSDHDKDVVLAFARFLAHQKVAR